MNKYHQYHNKRGREGGGGRRREGGREDVERGKGGGREGEGKVF